MLNYILLVLVFLLSGCVEKRVIQISEVDRSSVVKRPTITNRTRVPRPSFPREERVKEEILIRNNPNLGNLVKTPVSTREEPRVKRVRVPRNRPILDVNLSEFEADIGIGSVKNEIKQQRVEEPRLIERIEFPEEEYINLPKFGSNEVSGRVYLIDSNTDEEIASRNLKLYLNPVTSYSKQWYEESYLNGNKMSPPDRRLFNYLRFTTSDDSGNFSFFGVPEGDYYLGVRIDCEDGCGSSKKKVIRIVKEIHVDGDLRDIELSKSIP